LDLGLFFGFLRRIAPLFAEKKREIAQIQLFWNRLSILGQAPRSLVILSNLFCYFVHKFHSVMKYSG